MPYRTDARIADIIAVVWSLIVIQGAVLVTSSLESLAANAVQGFALLPVLVITVAGAVLTLVTARGVRDGRRWARRVALAAEWFLITLGVAEIAASLVLTGASIDLMPVLALIVVPGAVLVGLRRIRLAEREAEPLEAQPEAPVVDVAVGQVG